jgi:hypothetical protein
MRFNLQFWRLPGSANHTFRRWTWLAGWLAWLTGLLRCPVRAEEGLSYKFENYSEHGGRSQIRTHSVLGEVEVPGDLTLRAQWLYDGISGATPTGAPPPAGSDAVPLVQLTDIRRAETAEVVWRRGAHTVAPLFTHSEESDYESFAPGLHYALDLNEKNTTFNLGLARNFDEVRPAQFRRPRRRDEWDVLLGWVQVLGPRSLLTVNLTLGTASGFLSDPYKRVRFDGYPDPRNTFPEQRPGHRTRQVLWVGWNQAVPAAEAAVETSYRFSHDSFGVFGHTAAVEWFQNLGPKLIVAPLFRYHRQTAANFYAIRFEGDPSDPESFPDVVLPAFYSSDHRLSELETFTCGVSVSWQVHRRWTVEGAYKRYWMQGLDGATVASNYPEADVWTAGLRFRF